MATKYKQMKINLKEEDYLKVKTKADFEDISIAEFIRRLTDSKSLYTKKEHSKDYKELIFQINKIGNNINQITRVIHKDKNANIKMLEYLECRFHSKFPAVSQTCFHFFNGESGCKIVA